jgi:hypothetical protein
MLSDRLSENISVWFSLNHHTEFSEKQNHTYFQRCTEQFIDDTERKLEGAIFEWFVGYAQIICPPKALNLLGEKIDILTPPKSCQTIITLKNN